MEWGGQGGIKIGVAKGSGQGLWVSEKGGVGQRDKMWGRVN